MSGYLKFKVNGLDVFAGDVFMYRGDYYVFDYQDDNFDVHATHAENREVKIPSESINEIEPLSQNTKQEE